MRTIVIASVCLVLAVFASGCGALLSTFVPQQQTQQPVYPVYVEQQQPIVVPSTTTVNPTPVVVTPNY